MAKIFPEKSKLAVAPKGKRCRKPLRVPLGNERIGGGDLVARWTKLVGIKPCEGCRLRRARLNRVVQFGK